MDQNKPELTLDESIKQVMQTLPPVIRAYLAEGKYTPVARNLMTKYGLRIDQGGVLEREIMLLLMGIEAPDEFTKALIEEARLGAQVVDSIVQDINAQIFIPLRAEEMKSSKAVIPEPSRPMVPRPTPPSSAPRIPPIGFRGDQVSIEPRKLLEDHEEPHIEFAKVPVVPVPPRPTTPTPLAPGLPKWSPPNLPGSSSEGSARSVIQATPANPSIPKSYSSDPYREPIFEEGKE